MPAAVPSAAPLAPEPVVPPQPVSTELAYPPQASGEQEVVLELTISVSGAVSEARVVSGAEPFSSTALAASKAWRFEPATRAGLAVAAKIRFQVRFVPPTRAGEDSGSAGLSAPRLESSKSALSLAAREPVVREILVVGQREPLKVTLGRAELHDLPGAFGDPYRAIEALPGVVPIVSGLPYFYVRGAPPGNVGYFFDGIPVPYLYHFAAGPGVLQPSFVDHVDLYPGAYPARYGRFAGAIVAGEMAAPSERLRGEASIRLVDSGATIEAPFASGRGEIMLGGRFSYTAAVLSLLVPDVSLDYWDYQARLRYELDSKNAIEVLAFGAHDFLSQIENDSESSVGLDGQQTFRSTRRENTLVDVGFQRLDLRWDHALPSGNWRNAIMLGLDGTGGDRNNVSVKNRMLGVRSEYRRALGQKLSVRAGADVLFESLTQTLTSRDPSSADGGSIANDGSQTSDEQRFGFDRARRDLTSGVWADVVLAVNERVEVTPGLRADLFVSGGRAALSFDPRISARYVLSSRVSVTHGLALVHQAPSFVVPVPGLKPSLRGGLQSAVQHSVGVAYGLPAGFESSLTVFQNAFFNLTDLISLIQLQSATSANETDFRATGHAYGAELSIRRSLARRLGGFVSYTLSRSLRSSGELHGPATTDRTHVLNIGVSSELGRNWRLGGRWLFYSGIPTHVAYVQAAQAPPRTPPFWRLDFKLQKRWFIKPPNAWWGVSLEVLNTTLNREVLQGDCNAFSCKYQSFGPVTIPSIGVEGAL